MTSGVSSGVPVSSSLQSSLLHVSLQTDFREGSPFGLPKEGSLDSTLKQLLESEVMRKAEQP